jgi:hypothetical protein
VKVAPRNAAFVLAASDYGPVILNRLDHHQLPDGVREHRLIAPSAH